MATAELLSLSRRGWLALEGLHIVGYFAPEVRESFAALGVTGRHGYFAGRSAAMGAVEPAVTVATFYVFAPRAVESSLPQTWSVAAPADVIAARYDGASRALRRILGADRSTDPVIVEAADLVAAVCEGLTAPGRALYAGHASVAWPEDPLLRLWHAATLVREHRGDGHVHVLLAAGLAPLDSSVLNGIATGSTDFLERRRGWTPQEWAQARERLVERGLLVDEHRLSDEGTALVAHLEAETDRLALEGWEHLGEPGARRLVELLEPITAEVLADPDLPAWFAARR